MRLSDICEINPKAQILADDTETSFVTMSDVSEDGQINTKVIRPYRDVKKGFTSFSEGDVLFAKITPCMENGKGALATGLFNGLGFGSTEFHVLRPLTDKALGKWIYYLTAWSAFRKNAEKNMTGSAGQKRVPKSFLEKYEVNVPPLDTQLRQVQALNQLKNIINCKKLQISNLDDLIKARFIEMFGDVIQNNMEWTQYVFSDITTSRLGKMLDAKQQTGKYTYPYLANYNVQWFRFELNNLNEMDFNEADQIEFALKDGDLLVCEGGEIGRCAVWHNEVQPCYFQKALHRVRCNTDVILPDYLSRWFQYNCEHGGFASIEGAKATISHLPGAKLKALQVVTPPIDLQKDFVRFAAQIDKSKDVKRKISKNYTELIFYLGDQAIPRFV